MTLVLTGLEISVYTRIVRMALAEKYLRYSFVEADPFAEAPDPALLRMNPFRRVPVLSHDGFAIFETNAILRYLDAAFPEPALVPHTPRAAARMAQVMGIVDCYGYWPLVRQVFSHRGLAPLSGDKPVEDQIGQGLQAAIPVLGALERIAEEGIQLNGHDISLADMVLAPMIDYFQMAPEGRDMLEVHGCLCDWWHQVRRRRSFEATRPAFAGPLT